MICAVSRKRAGHLHAGMRHHMLHVALVSIYTVIGDMGWRCDLLVCMVTMTMITTMMMTMVVMSTIMLSSVTTYAEE